MKKCNETEMCEALSERIEEANARRKGLVPIYVTNMKTDVTRFLGVAYKKDRTDNGLMLNVCPFCTETPGSIKEEEIDDK